MAVLRVRLAAPRFTGIKDAPHGSTGVTAIRCLQRRAPCAEEVVDMSAWKASLNGRLTGPRTTGRLQLIREVVRWRPKFAIVLAAAFSSTEPARGRLCSAARALP